MSMDRAERLLEEIRTEFPRFRVRYKRESALQRATHVALVVLTLGGQRAYITRYHTVMFDVLWVPDAWDEMADLDKYVLLRHERVHLRQRRRLGDVWMTFLYLVPFFPIGLAYGRARIEWEAYTETIRATVEVYGVEAARRLRTPLIARFTGPDYGWMWPFPRVVGAWFDKALEDAAAERGVRA
jgi:hypothetical protein